MVDPNARPEVLLVYKKSKLALYVHEKKHERFARLVEEGGSVGTTLEAAHLAHLEALETVKRACADAGLKVRIHYRARVTRESTAGRLVITVGGDGTVLDASHKIVRGEEADTVLLGVNSDPERSVGFLCAANADNFADTLESVLDGSLKPTPLRRIGGDIDGTPLPFPVLNEVLFAHQNPAGTSRYDLSVESEAKPGTFGFEEAHKSSGLWVAGPVGSTAAIASAGGSIRDLGDDALQAVVREPYVTSEAKRPRLDHLLIHNRSLRLRSRIREGRLYLDGPHKIVPLPVGATLMLHLNAPSLPLIVTREMAQRRAELVKIRDAHDSLVAEATRHD